MSEVIWVSANQIARLLLGATPADIPFVQPIKFQLIANVKAAQAIGLTLPQSWLLRADEVVECEPAPGIKWSKCPSPTIGRFPVAGLLRHL
jgi:hypothetical protein